MDRGMLKNNLKAAIAKMPPDLQLDFGKLWTGVEKHFATFQKIGPEVYGLLESDIMTIAVEWQCKMLNVEDLNTVIREAFAECGIALPDEPKKA